MPTYGTNVPCEEHNSAFQKSNFTAAEVIFATPIPTKLSTKLIGMPPYSAY